MTDVKLWLLYSKTCDHLAGKWLVVKRNLMFPATPFCFLLRSEYLCILYFQWRILWNNDVHEMESFLLINICSEFSTGIWQIVCISIPEKLVFHFVEQISVCSRPNFHLLQIPNDHFSYQIIFTLVFFFFLYQFAASVIWLNTSPTYSIWPTLVLSLKLRAFTTITK